MNRRYTAAEFSEWIDATRKKWREAVDLVARQLTAEQLASAMEEWECLVVTGNNCRSGDAACRGPGEDGCYSADQMAARIEITCRMWKTGLGLLTRRLKPTQMEAALEEGLHLPGGQFLDLRRAA